jgi:hypothetical protein
VAAETGVKSTCLKTASSGREDKKSKVDEAGVYAWAPTTSGKAFPGFVLSAIVATASDFP